MSSKPTKPGYKTTEFFLTTLVWLLAAFLASGVLPDAHLAVRIAAFISSTLATLGYTWQRGYLKG